MDNQTSRGNFWRILAMIGGIAGLVAILGLIVAVAQLWQSVDGQNRQDIAQATEAAFAQAHLDELEKIVTLQAKQVEGPESDSAATAIAVQIENLESTIEATGPDNPVEATPRPTLSTVAESDTSAQGSASTDCSKLIIGEHHEPVLGTYWEFKLIDEDRNIHIWSNHWDPNLPEFKFFLPAGQSVSFMSGGGSYWADRPGCNGVAQVEYDRDVFEEISLEEYQTYIELGIIP